jgi:hypothetical protein
MRSTDASGGVTIERHGHTDVTNRGSGSFEFECQRHGSITLQATTGSEINVRRDGPTGLRHHNFSWFKFKCQRHGAPASPANVPLASRLHWDER